MRGASSRTAVLFRRRGRGQRCGAGAAGRAPGCAPVTSTRMKVSRPSSRSRSAHNGASSAPARSAGPDPASARWARHGVGAAGRRWLPPPGVWSAVESDASPSPYSQQAAACAA